ncbi:MAG TPA: hypothetical protein VGB03_06640 [Acidimicrobiales bacterium]
MKPEDFVVLDQSVDRTNGRADTFFDGGVVGHVSFADPYRSVLPAAAGRSACGCASALSSGPLAP